MSKISLTHLSDATLTRDLADLVERDRRTTVVLLAHIDEFDHRRLYLPAGEPSMFSYCVRRLRMSEDVAYKRIRAARASRRCPGILSAIEEGRLTLSAVVLLAPHLATGMAEDLLAAGMHKTNAQIEQLLADRFPKPDLATRVRALPTPGQLAVRPVSLPVAELPAEPLLPADQLAARPVEMRSQVAPQPVESKPPRVKPLAPERYSLQLTMSKAMHDDLRHAQALLRHQIPSGDVVEVLGRALKALIRDQEKAKFAATDRPQARTPGQESGLKRHVPASVKRAVCVRDGDRCTFVSDSGNRCPAREFLEFDHIVPIARGGATSAGNIRLRCRAHNQMEAERAFGTQFMENKRRAAIEARNSAASTSSRVFFASPKASAVVQNLIEA